MSLNPENFRMPAEWEPHAATWLSWPHNPDTWPDKFDPVPAIWARMVKELHLGETVHINVNDEAMKKSAAELLRKQGVDLSQIVFHLFPTNDCWMRDCGPIFVKDQNGVVAQTHWKFNKWGGKYPPWDLDAKIPAQMAAFLKQPFFETGIVMEGGSLDVNGKGTLLTTESCLLNPNRNPGLSKKDIENYFRKFLGITNVLWLGDGIEGDDTDGHVDDLSRFVDERTVVTVVEADPAEINFKPLQENLKRLQMMKDEQGRPLTVLPIPLPRPLYHEGQRLPASYANFYIGNAAVLVPVFNDPNDVLTLSTLEKFFPGRKVVGIPSIDLVWGLGAFHCITQQVPLPHI